VQRQEGHADYLGQPEPQQEFLTDRR